MRKQNSKRQSLWVFGSVVGSLATFGSFGGEVLAAEETAEVKRVPPVTRKLQLEGGLEVGIREDNFHWSIAGTSAGTDPNILSELTWTDIRSRVIKGRVKGTLNERFQARGEFSYGWIYDGTNQDSDYNGDNRTLEYSRSNNSSDTGEVWDISMGVGYVIPLQTGSQGGVEVELVPLVGLSYHEQHFYITDGFQTIPATGTISGLNSTYQTEWLTAWMGLGIDVQVNDQIDLNFLGQYHRLDYYAAADWNLRTDFAHPISYEHTALGDGWSFSGGGSFAFSEQVAVTLNLGYRNWIADQIGSDITYFSDGSIGGTKVNEVVLESREVMLGVEFRF